MSSSPKQASSESTSSNPNSSESESDLPNENRSKPSASNSTNQLVFSRIGVKRLYGIEHNVVAEGLCDGINILYGPNASGKTTLARAIERAIWPNGQGHPEDDHPIVSGTFRMNGASWQIDVDGARYRYEKDHQPADQPAFPSSEYRDRYHLYLPDLLGAISGDTDLARYILQEARGGVDVRGSADELGWTEVPSANKGKIARELESIREKLQEATQKQQALQGRERDLNRLKHELNRAKQAAGRVRALQQAITVVEARVVYEKAEAALDSFPDSMDRVRGNDAHDDNDVEVLRRLKKTVRSAKQTIEKNQKHADDATETLQDSILPEEGLSVGDKQTIQSTVDRLSNKQTKIQHLHEQLSGKEDKEKEAWNRLDVGTARDRAAQINLPDLAAVEQHARTVNGLHEKEEALQNVADRLADDSEVPSAQKLREGIRQLSRWLQAPADKEQDTPDATDGDSTRLSNAAAVLSAVIALLGGVLIFTTSSLSFGIALIIVGLALLGIEVARRTFRDRDPVTSSGDLPDRAVFQDEFQRTDLEPPSSWTTKSVETAVDDLLERLQRAVVFSAKVEERKQLERDRTKVEEQLADLDAEREQLAEQVGLVPDVSSHTLYWLVEQLSNWQGAYDEVKALQGRLANAQEIRDDILDRLNDQLTPYQLGGVSTAEEAAGAVADLEAARDRFETAKRQQKDAKREMQRAEKEEAEAREKIAALYDRLELEEGDEEGVRSLVSDHDEYKTAKEQAREKQTVLETQLKQLKNERGYKNGLENQSKEILKERLHDAEEQAEREEELREEIGDIERQIKSAREGSTVGQLRARYEAKRDELIQRRYNDYKSATGYVLAEFVRNETQTESLPGVFHRARELFAEITQYRYKLDLDFDNETFRAIDTRRDRGFALDALSSGTKVQLLLAVRVAFVEKQEQGPRLPLVLDETLANSDSEKAEAIIEAIGTLCETTGRQVFYLTAQQDEVRKWMQQMENRTVACEVKALDDDPSEWDGWGDGAVIPIPATTVDTEALRGTPHPELKEVLSVRAWTPQKPVSDIHLWYLVDDPDALLDLIERGVKTWGQLEFQYQQVGTAATPLSEAKDRHVQALAKALRSWQKAWKVGRGKPISREVLLDSGAVSDTYINRVSELANELDGNAEALLYELREGDDPRTNRFRKNKADELEAYCESNGYLDPREPHNDEEMWSYVIADVSSELGDVLTRETLEALFSRVHSS